MLATTPAHRCPACGSQAISVLGIVESDPLIAPKGDLEIYSCPCGEEFDNEDPRLTGRIPSLIDESN